MRSKVRVMPPMRLIDSTLHLTTVTAYTVRELPCDGAARIFEYAYIEAVRIKRP